MCYLHDMFKRMKPHKGCIAIPYLSITEKNVSTARDEEQIFNEPVNAVEYHEDFLATKDLKETMDRCMTHGKLRSLLFEQPLETLPSLSFLRSYQIPCTDVKVRKEVQREIDSLFLIRFLQGGQDYGYDTFRREFLQTMLNIPTCVEQTTTHLVSLMDLNVRPDFFQYMNLDFDPTAFDPSVFKLNMGSALRPKEFDFPKDFPMFDDFSHFVDSEFTTVCDEIGINSLTGEALEAGKDEIPSLQQEHSSTGSSSE